jgi:hypothetical protein
MTMSLVRLASVLAALSALLFSGAGGAGATPPPPPPPDFGPNVLVFDPSMTTAQIQAQVDAVSAQQTDDEFSSQRYALLFKPGTYGSATEPLQFTVGYYTEVAGLGASPNDVTINGKIEVYNRCLADGGTSNCLALVNFWRSLSNLTINVNAAGQDGCRASANFWAVSQAAPMRRVNVTGSTNLSLMDYCTAGPQYASGGFIADSNTTFVVNGSQQQFLVRDSSVAGWSNAVWNQVFSGVSGAPDGSAFPNPPYTVLAASPVTRERPYLTYDGTKGYRVVVPDARTNSSGTNWGAGPAAGESIPIEDFFVAAPTDDAKTINTALARGDNVLLTPGVYHLDRSLEVRKADTVVLGLGFPTLVPDDGDAAITVGDVTGIELAGIIVDAGAKRSPVLVEVGKPNAHKSEPGNPTTLSDVFFRIGGAAAGRATAALVVNSDDVILDDIWAWRADHGNGVGWTTNLSDTGVIVNGDDVIAYGLFVEHFQKTEVIWNGERGRTILFQNEMPYDVPDQASWLDGASLGFPAYQVADSVKTHEAWGAGSYCFFNVNPTVHASRGFEVPVTAGVKMHHLMTVNLSAGTIDHVINDTGGPATTAAIGVPVYVTEFP